ncbi:MAG TPA: family 2A encapsulin nanocompartment cargo protein cysteine desulfurase [Chitinophaga sp.]|uniref:family 2A encapsulin nanocompartment cargo protein cysteine desulfurase n=1 Tax=Chitinophaga sp. TaxID=1869181 RepID=UPI002B61C257|nr:family 2A encapsulin nanocompartment cargo protein cysteine desulfurase [Chitinophaga sp.]HVI48942.1 family 2A encapsulin nanocompartment cargo protein cysteine desulfurase [Chitinophaga sp.]
MNTNNFQPEGLPDEAALEHLANELFRAMQTGNSTSAPSYAPTTPTGNGVSPQPYNGPAPIRDPLLQQGSVTDVRQAPTSLPDPHFAGSGLVPASVAGSGISPSAAQQPYPGIRESSLEQELQKALKQIHTPLFSGQLPGQSPSYYFLDHSALSGIPTPPLDINRIRADFPILQEHVNGKRLIWLDNAATTQKPIHVIDRISHFYKHENSNIHRAAHELAARATDAYEDAREKVRAFLNASSVNEIIFVRGATEAINLVAKSWGEQFLQSGDEIIVSHLEHHANIVPWQQLASQKGLSIKVIPVDDDGQIILEEYARLLGPKTKLVAFTQVSNALGTITPAQQIVEMAHQAGAKVLVDGAQAVSHMRSDMQSLNPDWYVFSGHKVFGPTGIGVLYGKEALLNETRPWQGGGNMIKDVTFEHTQYQQAPARFEAGTGNIADAVGLGAAIDYINHIGIEVIHQYEHYLLQYATSLLKNVPGLRLIGTAPDKTSVLSFVMKGHSTEQVGSALNQQGIAVRSGHHCAQPILRRFGVESTVRPSLAFYNTCSDIDALVQTLYRLGSV